MNKKINISQVFIKGCLALASLSVVGIFADPSPPEWDGDPGSIYLKYLFPADEFSPEFPAGGLSPDPDGYVSPFPLDIPSILINVGADGTGWQEPDTIDRTFTDDHGAWDIGQDGSIDISLKLGEQASMPGFTGYNIEYQFNAITWVFTSFSEFPDLQIDGYNPEDDQVQDTFLEADVFGNWYNRTFTGSVFGIMEDNLSFSIFSANPGLISVIDSIEVFVIPEPGSLMLMLIFLGSAGILLMSSRKRRRRP